MKNERSFKGRSRANRSRKKLEQRTGVETKVGWLERIGTTPWGKPLVNCPQCGQPATAGRTGDVWCRACGFDTAVLVGCG